MERGQTNVFHATVLAFVFIKSDVPFVLSVTDPVYAFTKGGVITV
jgi:hypothetical protein